MAHPPSRYGAVQTPNEIQGDEMADRVWLVDYFHIKVLNRPGTGARALSVLKEAGVNLIAFNAFPTRWVRAQLNFVPADSEALKAAARTAKWRVAGPRQALLIESADGTRSLADYFTKLGEAKIRVTATSAIVTASGRAGTILWVKPRDLQRAVQVLDGG